MVVGLTGVTGQGARWLVGMAHKYELGPVPILLRSLMAKSVRGNWKMEDLVWNKRNARVSFNDFDFVVLLTTENKHMVLDATRIRFEGLIDCEKQERVNA